VTNVERSVGIGHSTGYHDFFWSVGAGDDVGYFRLKFRQFHSGV